MLAIQEALDAVREHARPLAAARQPLEQALSRVLAEDIRADLDLPPFDKALVDGFAIRFADLKEGTGWLGLGEVILAGRTPSRALGPGEAATIMTGAPVPPGCDAVVMHERTRSAEGRVWIEEREIRPGKNVLARGREMRAGEVLLTSGTILEPAHLGVLASVGRVEVQVVPRPRVLIVPTGDELVDPGQVPGPGQIRNSNAIMLKALAWEAGIPAESLPITPDEPRALRESLERGLDADCLMITGGVSAGQRDLVPQALLELDVGRVFHKVRLKPGKPLWFGVGPPRSTRPPALVFGLPGNPVSGLVGFHLFVRPALAILAGKPEPAANPIEATLSREFSHRGDRPTYHPARVIAAGSLQPGPIAIETLDWAGSADLRTTAIADGFAVFPAGDREYVPGELVRFLPTRGRTMERS
jgi:molybdopterin molybdotransferase